MTFSNIYTAEASPAHLRAVMVALFSEWVNIGSIIGAVVTNATQTRLDKASYQIPIGTLFIVPVLLSVGLFFVPESPRYLVNKGHMEEARRALEALRGDSLRPEEFELEWMEMVKGIEEERRLASTIGPLDQFRGTDLRRTLLCYGVILSQVGSGSWFIISYSTYFFIVAGLTTAKAFQYAIVNTCLGLVGVNLGIFLMRHVVGRRMILIIGSAFQGAWMLGMAIGAGSVNTVGSPAGSNAVIAFMALYTFTYNAFVGDASYPVSTELVSTRLRSWTVGSAISLGYFFAWLTGFCSPYFINPQNLNWVRIIRAPESPDENWHLTRCTQGAKYGYLWAGSNLICMIFFFFFMPELKGRTLEEIDELFANRISAWKFKSYKTTIQEQALAEVRRQEGLVDEKHPGSETIEDTKTPVTP